MGKPVSMSVRKKTATVVQKNRKKGHKYRFPMPDKKHARLALQMLPKAKGLSAEEKQRIRNRAHRMLGTSTSKKSTKKSTRRKKT